MRPAARDRPVRANDPPAVLIVAHAAGLAAAIQTALQQAGMAVELAASGTEALARQAARPAGMVVVDLDAPDMADAALVAALGADGQSGVIAIARDAGAAARLRGTLPGADDVVGKPVALMGLVARLRALHRRRRRPAGRPAPRIGIDRAAAALVDASGRRTPLTEPELIVLETLLEAEGASVSREWLGRISLQRLVHDGDAAVDALVAGLRRKLAAHGVSPRTIQPVRGQGYLIADPAVFAEPGER